MQSNDAQATGIRMLPLMGGLIVGAAFADQLTAKAGYKTTTSSPVDDELARLKREVAGTAAAAPAALPSPETQATTEEAKQ